MHDSVSKLPQFGGLVAQVDRIVLRNELPESLSITQAWREVSSERLCPGYHRDKGQKCSVVGEEAGDPAEVYLIELRSNLRDKLFDALSCHYCVAA